MAEFGHFVWRGARAGTGLLDALFRAAGRTSGAFTHAYAPSGSHLANLPQKVTPAVHDCETVKWLTNAAGVRRLHDVARMGRAPPCINPNRVAALITSSGRAARRIAPVPLWQCVGLPALPGTRTRSRGRAARLL